MGELSPSNTNNRNHNDDPSTNPAFFKSVDSFVHNVQITMQKETNRSRSPTLSGSSLINMAKEQILDLNRAENSIHPLTLFKESKKRSSSKTNLSNVTKNCSSNKPEEKRNSKKSQFFSIENDNMKDFDKNDDKFIYLVSPDNNSNFHQNKRNSYENININLKPKSQSLVAQNLLSSAPENISISQIEKLQSPVGMFSPTFQSSESPNNSQQRNRNRGNSNSRKSRSDDKMSKLMSPILRRRSTNQKNENFFNEERVEEFCVKDRPAQEYLTKTENEEDAINFYYSKESEKDMALQAVEDDLKSTMLQHLDNYNEQVLNILNKKLAKTLDLEVGYIENKLREEVYKNITSMLQENIYKTMDKKEADFVVKEIDQCLIPQAIELDYVNIQELDSNLSKEINEEIIGSINYKNDFHVHLSSSLIKNVRTLFQNINEIMQKHLEQKIESLTQNLTKDTMSIFTVLFTQLSAKRQLEEEILQTINNEKNLTSRKMNHELDINKPNSVIQTPKKEMSPNKYNNNELKGDHINKNSVVSTKAIVEKTISNISKSLTLFDAFIEKKKLSLARQSKDFEEEMNKLTKNSASKQESTNNNYIESNENDKKNELTESEPKSRALLTIVPIQNQNYKLNKIMENAQQTFLKRKIEPSKPITATEKKNAKRILTAVTEQSELSIDDHYSKRGGLSPSKIELGVVNQKIISVFSTNHLIAELPIYDVYNDTLRRKTLTDITEFSSRKDSSPGLEPVHNNNDYYKQDTNEYENEAKNKNAMQYKNMNQITKLKPNIMIEDNSNSNINHNNSKFVSRKSNENLSENSGASPKSSEKWLSIIF